MKDTVLLLPDPDWVIVKSPKALDTGDWYAVRHKHKDTGSTKEWYCCTSGDYDTSDGVRRQHKCAWCNEPVPEVVQGFRNLCEWSEA